MNLTSSRNDKNPLLSVIIPVYNTEKLLSRCLESVNNQTYKNIEIVIVNDGSDNEPDIPKQLNIKYIKHQKNLGLYKTRIDGYNASSGNYVCFLDSDDYISKDFYRTMILKAIIGNFDIVAGNTIFENIDGSKYVRNLHESNFGTKDLYGNDVKKAYYEQQGSCFVWHTIWNKIYKRSLWKKCIGLFDSVKDNIVMTEDILFSSVLFFNAESFSYVKNEGYHYCENKKSSTSVANVGLEKFEKNINSMVVVFDTVESYIKNNGASQKLLEDFTEFRKFYSRIWRSFQEQHFSSTKLGKKTRDLVDKIMLDYVGLSSESDHFFEMLSTPYDSTVEDIKNIIINPDVKVVSFDIFDTLIVRPFLNPEDIYELVEENNESLDELSGIPFSQIRKQTESDLRSKWWKIKPGSEDFTLSDIYIHMANLYGLSEKVINSLMSTEKNLEIKFCKQRKIAKDLFDLVKYLDKRIIITSDMYLDIGTVEKILENNNYLGYEKLFLSSKQEHTKFTGKLYEDIIKYVKEKPESIVHIGDDWNKDFLKSQSYNIISVLLPKTIESFKGVIKNVNTNSLAWLGPSVLEPFIQTNQLENSYGYRSMIECVSNRLFDNPYPSYSCNSDFNASAEIIGYYVVGMHLMGISKWLNDELNNNKTKEIAFLSRDGYTVKKAFDIYIGSNSEVSSKYVCCSRRCLMPWMIKRPIDLLNLPIEIRAHSQKTIAALLEFCLDFGEDDTGKLLDEKFNSFEEYKDTIDLFIKNYFSYNKLNEMQSMVRKYYRSMISENSIVFDMGYSGRIAVALSDALGYPVKYMYVYKNEASCDHYENKYNIHIKTLYNSTPVISGFIREYLLSEPNNGCIGFEYNNTEVVPVFEKKVSKKLNRYTIESIQQYALEFVKEYVDTFSGYRMPFKFNPYLVSLSFESMMIKIKDFDRYLFKNSFEDDTTYGGSNMILVYDFWGDFLRDYYNKCSRRIFPINVEEYSPFNNIVLNKMFGFGVKLYSLLKTKYNF